jgi:hypothetical protein
MTIGAKVETAFSQVIEDLAIAGMSVYKGIANVEKAAPAVIVRVNGITESFPESGLWRVQTAIDVKYIGADSDADSADAVVDAIYAASLDPAINATLAAQVANFKVDGVLVGGSQEEQIADDAWVKTLNLEVICNHGGS